MAKVLENYVFPAGDYYIGDLCYTMHDEWKEICEVICHPNFDDSFAVIQLDDGRIIGWSKTEYGDGEYLDNNGRSYGVDSGSLGCILLSDISEKDIGNVRLGNQVEMTKDFLIDYNRGDVIFGDLIIKTVDNEEEEYDYYDCDEFEDEDEEYLIDRDGDY
jgi:hypothetical protein